MGYKQKCPWCDEKFQSNKYRLSAGMMHVHQMMSNHIGSEHPKKEQKCNKLLDRWKEMYYKSNGTSGFLDQYRDLYASLRGKKPDRPTRNSLAKLEKDPSAVSDEELQRFFESL